MIRAELKPAPIQPVPDDEVHLIMSKSEAAWLRDILSYTHTGAFFQELERLIGKK